MRRSEKPGFGVGRGDTGDNGATEFAGPGLTGNSRLSFL